MGGLSFDFKDDFVMIAAIMSLESTNLQTWLCEISGQTVSISRGLFSFFKQKYRSIKLDDFKLFNVFTFMPFLEEAIKKNPDFIDGKSQFKIRNLQSSIILPQKINLIVDVLREKLREEELLAVNISNGEMLNQYTMEKTLNENQSTLYNKEKSKTRVAKYLSKIEKILGNNPKKQLLLEKFQNLNMNNFEIANLLLENMPVEKFNIFLNLDFYKHVYGDNENENFQIFSLTTFFGSNEMMKHMQAAKSTKSESEEMNEDEISLSVDMIKTLPHNDTVAIKKIFNRTTNHTNTTKIEVKPKITINMKKENPNDFVKRKNLSDISDTGKSEEFEVENEMGKGNKFFSNQKRNVDWREESQGSSSVNSISQSFLVFKQMDVIQNSVPTTIRRSFLVIASELFLVVLFCILYWIISSSYIDTYHKPTQKSLINLCKMGSSVYLSTILSIEYEYEKLGLSKIGSSAEIFQTFFKNNFQVVNEIGHEKLSEVTQFEYQNLYKNYSVDIVDYQSKKMKSITYADLVAMDSIIIASLVFSDSENNYDLIKNLPRNFPAFLNATSLILDSTEHSFLNSNVETTNNLMIVMLVFLFSKILLKLLEYKFLSQYQKRITQILNLLRRVNENDAANEIQICHETLKIMNDPSEIYLQTTFSEKCLNKLDSENEDLPPEKKEKANDKSKKKKLVYDFKSFPKSHILFFILFFVMVSFSFFFFNFYYWSMINESIKSLIQINIFFEKLYFLSITTLCLQKNLLRAQIIDEPSYSNLNNIFQQEDYRRTYFKNIFDEKMITLKEIVAFSLAKYSLQAKKDINSELFSDLIQFDVCQVLVNKKIINAEYLKMCEKSLYGAFKKGIISAINEYFNEISSLDVFLDVPIDLNNNQQFKDYINDTYSDEYDGSSKDFIIAAKFLNDALLLYYSYINDYYNEIMEGQINGLKYLLLFTTILLFIIIFILAYFTKIFLKKAYKYCALTLGIIPLNKILNDKPTVFLINQLVKDGQLDLSKN